MHCIQNITEDLYWIGGSDRRLAVFEGLHTVPKGMSYNSYILIDKKTVVFDAVDASISELYFENIEEVLKGNKLDYLVLNHMEPDHSATVGQVLLRYPEVTIVANSKVITMLHRFFEIKDTVKFHEVKEGECLNTGVHELTFLFAPMVHWPEVMMTYDKTDHVLFSADAFGTFGSLDGNIFADQLNFKEEWLPEARRYYTNIVGKYGVQTLKILSKIENLEVDVMCPLHGPIWREDIAWYVEKYIKWASYIPEEQGVVIVFASVYGNTDNAASILANELAKNGVKNIKVYDLSKTEVSYCLSECFRFSHMVLASTTYNGGLFPKMEEFILDIKGHNLQNRGVGVIENGTWAPTAGRHIKSLLEQMKEMRLLEEVVTVSSSVKKDSREEITELAKKISKDILK